MARSEQSRLERLLSGVISPEPKVSPDSPLPIPITPEMRELHRKFYGEEPPTVPEDITVDKKPPSD